MNKMTVAVVFVFAIIVVVAYTPMYPGALSEQEAARRDQTIREDILRQMKAFRAFVQNDFLVAIESEKADTQNIRQAFLQARVLYKKFEWAAAYFNAELTERLNGPPVQEIENAELLDSSMSRGINPVGLQTIEEYLYPVYNKNERAALAVQVERLLISTDYLISYFADLPLTDWRILDAVKLEIFRIITLGITGFDNSLALNGLAESAASIKSLREVISLYPIQTKAPTLTEEMDLAAAYLVTPASFDDFDRAFFITRYANKITAGITALEQGDQGEKIKYNRMLFQSAGTLFDSNAFNADAFSPGPEYHSSPEKVALGKALFFDASLSGTGTRSCASCHNPGLSFTDGLAKNTSIHDANVPLRRNAPTLLNAALQSSYFYDMRALTLEDQVRDVISNPLEMDGSIHNITKYVASNKTYKGLFEKAFPVTVSQPTIDFDKISNALAAYVRSLTKLNSRFDEYMRGDEKALSKEELNGFNLFTGKAKCATCHFVPLFNGALPPQYVTSETEALGVPVSEKDSILDPDRGYYDLIGVDSYKYAFKVPTVRNIGKTSPYMHNGAFRTLEQVMEFYNQGGGAGLRINLPNQTLSRQQLRLTEKEKKEVIAFMKSLESR